MYCIENILSLEIYTPNNIPYASRKDEKAIIQQKLGTDSAVNMNHGWNNMHIKHVYVYKVPNRT